MNFINIAGRNFFDEEIGVGAQGERHASFGIEELIDHACCKYTTGRVRRRWQ